jgi:hypothetical protein
LGASKRPDTLARFLIALIILAFLALVGWATSFPGTWILASIFIDALWAFALLIAILAAVAIYAPEHQH